MRLNSGCATLAEAELERQCAEEEAGQKAPLESAAVLEASAEAATAEADGDKWGDGGDAELTASEREIALPRLRRGAHRVGAGRHELVLRPRASALGLGTAGPLSPPAPTRSTSVFSIADGSADECPICLAEPTRRAVLPCGHGYCTDCLLESIAEYGYRRCFLCRGVLFAGQAVKAHDRDASPPHSGRPELDATAFSEETLRETDVGLPGGGRRGHTLSGVLFGWFYYLHCSQLHWARSGPEENVGVSPVRRSPETRRGLFTPSTPSSSRLSPADSPRSGAL